VAAERAEALNRQSQHAKGGNDSNQQAGQSYGRNAKKSVPAPMAQMGELERQEVRMISIWWLILIIPLAASFGAFVMCLFVVAGESDKRVK
jgi:hypothetical protein